MLLPIFSVETDCPIAHKKRLTSCVTLRVSPSQTGKSLSLYFGKMSRLSMAIALLRNHALQPHDMQATVGEHAGTLHILLESQTMPA